MIFSSIQDGICVLDADMRIMLVNPAMERWYGHSMPLVGKKCYEAYHMRSSACKICPVLKTFRTGEADHEVVPRMGPGGEVAGWLDLYSFPVKDPASHKIIGAIEYVRDITERKAVEGELGMAAFRLATVMENIDEGITLRREDGRFIIYNSKMGDITGYTMQEANSEKDFISLICPDQAERSKMVTAMVDAATERGVVSEKEVTIRAKNGAVKTLLVSTSLMQHREGRMLLSVFRDISALKHMSQLKDDFISMVSHELRTPLSIVKEGVSLILDRIPGEINFEQENVLNSARRNIERLTRIIDNLLDISRIESGRIGIKKKPVDISELARQVAVSFGNKARERSIRLEMEFPAEPVMAEVDPDMVAEVVTNIVDNALKFTDEGYVRVGLKRYQGGVELYVEDSGIGISKEDMPKLFGKFQQFNRARESTEKGTGLGLSIAKGIVDMHGGSIYVESDPGSGTKVTVTIPVNIKNLERDDAYGK
jgi:PAS domain S-box-containing protein